MLTKTNHGAVIPLSETPAYECPHCCSKITRPSRLVRGTYYCTACGRTFYLPQESFDGL